MSHDRDSETFEERGARIRADVQQGLPARRAAEACLEACLAFHAAEKAYVDAGGDMHHKMHRKRWKETVGPAYWRLQRALHDLDEECSKRVGR